MMARTDERRNIRPYVLLACFAWGIILGFGFYLYFPTQAEKNADEKIRLAIEEKNKPKKSAAPVATVTPDRKPEDPTKLVLPINKIATKEIFGPDKKNIESIRDIPEISLIGMDTSIGLNGRNTPRALKPAPLDTDPPKVDFKRATPTRRRPTKPLTIDDIAPPELDD